MGLDTMEGNVANQAKDERCRLSRGRRARACASTSVLFPIDAVELLAIALWRQANPVAPVVVLSAERTLPVRNLGVLLHRLARQHRKY